jgi:hypothetical protein
MMLLSGALAAAGPGARGSDEDRTVEKPPDLVRFESAAGGYAVSVPPKWHVKEFPGDPVYQGFVTRSKIKDPQDRYTFGLSVVRLREARSAFDFKSADAAAMALEYANWIARRSGAGGVGVVLKQPGPARAPETHLFFITGGAKESCRMFWLVAAVHGPEWFHALWKVSCQEGRGEKAETLIRGMIDSLEVGPTWPKEGAGGP